MTLRYYVLDRETHKPCRWHGLYRPMKEWAARMNQAKGWVRYLALDDWSC